MPNNNNNNNGTTDMDFDPFEVLELNPCGDIQRIKTAFHQLSRRTHPDMAARSEQNILGDPDNFSRIKKAYDFLRAMDAKALAEYAFIKLAQSDDAAQMRSMLRTLHLDADKLKRLLSAGLFNAAKNGHVRMARLLLKRGADPRETGTVMVDGQMINKVTPLRIAAFNGHLEMCKLLVAHGKANVNQLLTRICGFFGWSPSDQDIKQMVCAACHAGHLDIVKHFGTGIDCCGLLAFIAASFNGRDDALRHLLSEEKASAERKRKASAERKRKTSARRNSDGGRSSSSSSGGSTSSSSSKSWRESAEPWYGILFIVGVVLLALAIIPAPVCAAILFATIFAFCKYPTELYNHLPEQFLDALTETYALYMEKLKRWFPDLQEMPFGIGAAYNNFKQTLTQMSESTKLKWIPGCGNIPNTARKIFEMLAPICPALLNDVGRVFVGAVLIFAVGSLLIYDLKAVVSTFILLIFVVVFVKFGYDDISRRRY
uniref:J domain-containing protein n=1 Tax=Globodera rostochiensis TaxID=31243 RepID=A0A914HTL2_GLORO